MSDYGDSINRSGAAPLSREKVSDVAMDETTRKAKSAAALAAELKRHKANNEMMNQKIRERMGHG